MKKFLFMAFAAIALWGCGDSSSFDTTDDTRNPDENLETGMWPSPHYITEYIAPSKVEVVSESGSLYLLFTGERYETSNGERSKNYAKAKPFIEFYGDTSYQGVVSPGAATALAYPIDKITISCEKDFDAEHPAGEPLDDVVKLDYTSFYNFVKGGYVYDFNKIPYDADFYSCTFDNVTADVTHLMQARTYGSYYGDRPVVVFASAPAESGKYNFTLETTINGKVYKSEFSHKFE